jgi:two-component system sensor histidine kinase ResE
LRAAQHEGHVRLTVVDTGEGIPPEDLPFIFDRFWRGDPARTHTMGTGGGLGLAIAGQLVRAHGGAIRADSTLGAGTAFTIELPVGGVGVQGGAGAGE